MLTVLLMAIILIAFGFGLLSPIIIAGGIVAAIVCLVKKLTSNDKA